MTGTERHILRQMFILLMKTLCLILLYSNWAGEEQAVQIRREYTKLNNEMRKAGW